MSGVWRRVMQHLKVFRRMPYWQQFGIATVVIILGAVVRYLTFDINPLIVYLPFALLIIFAFQPIVAVYSTLLSAAIGVHFFLTPLWNLKSMSAEWIAIIVIYVATKFLMIVMAHAMHRAYTDLHLISDELNHRVKNTMAVVQSIVNHTAKQAAGVDEFKEIVAQRLGALTKSHMLLTTTEWKSVSLRQIVEAQVSLLSPDAEEVVAVDGHNVNIVSSATVSLGMIFHELATNAVKHGALKPGCGGTVHVSWNVGAGMLSIRWVESGGPPVEAPTRRGFGSSLLQRLVRSLGGDVDMDFAPTGLVAQVQFKTDLTVEAVGG